MEEEEESLLPGTADNPVRVPLPSDKRKMNDSYENGGINISGLFSTIMRNQPEHKGIIKTALMHKHYHKARKLLQHDEMFPEDFQIRDIDVTNIHGKKLKKLVTARNKLLKWVIDDNVKEIEKITPVKKTKLYLSTSNQSALHAAVFSQSFNAYSYLLSIGAEFKDNDEREVLLDLNDKSYEKLQAAIPRYFWCDSKQYLNDLIKSSTFFPAHEDYLLLANYYFHKLDEIPEVVPILKVLQFASCLRIRFDLTCIEPHYTAPSNSRLAGGSTKYKLGIAFIAASSELGKNRILGKMAYELTHIAMEMLFENNSKPYYRRELEEEQKFDKILKKIKSLDAEEFPFLGILNGVFNVKWDDQHAELTARMFQILTEYPRQCRGENFDDIFQFHVKIIERCQGFIENDFLDNMKRSARQFSEIHGELWHLKDRLILWENVTEHNFLQIKDKNLLLLKSENTIMGLVRILQRLYGKDFFSFSHDYIAVKFNIFVSQFHKIFDYACSSAFKTLIVEVFRWDITSYDSNEFLKLLCKLFEVRPILKFVIITRNKEYLRIKNLLSEIKWIRMIEETDGMPLVIDTPSDSEKILEREIFFQGRKLKLEDILEDNQTVLESLKPNTLEILKINEEVIIGGKIRGTSSLEGAYTDLFEDVKISLFIHKAMNEDVIFIIGGILDHFIEILGPEIVKLDKALCFEYRLKACEEKERILFMDSELSNESFREFCHLNPGKKIYLTDIIHEGGEPKLILKRYYNPNFYSERRFKNKVLESSICDLPSTPPPTEQFVISSKNFPNEEGGSFEHTKNSNVHFFRPKYARKKFESFGNQKGISVHFFKTEERQPEFFFWKTSTGSLEFLRKRLINSGKPYDEIEFIDEIEDKKVLLIADGPGTGKTTTLTKLYEKKIFDELCISERHWLIYIDLKNCGTAMKIIDVDNLDESKVIEFLSDFDGNSKDELNRDFLHLALTSKYFKKPLLVVFDGYNEILVESDRLKLKFLMKYLVDRTNSKIWVTTRPNFKEELENEFSTFAFEFEKEEFLPWEYVFIKKYFKNRLDLVLNLDYQLENKRSNIYAQALTQHLKNNSTEKSVNLIGSPLQLFLILENYVSGFGKFVRGCDVHPNFFPSETNFNRLGIYDDFVNMKYDVYFKSIKLELRKEDTKNTLEECNKKLAEFLIFNVDSSELSDKHKFFMLETGIVKPGDINMQFIHFTFCEYYASQVFMEYFRNERQKKLDFEFIRIIITEILFKPEYQVLRTFINLRLEHGSVPKDSLRLVGEVMHFLLEKNQDVDCEKGTALHVAIDEGNKDIFKFLLYCCKKTFTNEELRNLLTKTDFLSRTIIHCCYDNDLLHFLFSVFRTLKLDPKVRLDILGPYEVRGQLSKTSKKGENDMSNIISAECERLRKKLLDVKK